MSADMMLCWVFLSYSFLKEKSIARYSLKMCGLLTGCDKCRHVFRGKLMVNFLQISGNLRKKEQKGRKGMKSKGILFAAMALVTVFLFSNMVSVVNAEQNDLLRGGINIMKTDVLGKGLPGARYQIAREATQAELRDSSVTKRLLKTGDQTITVVHSSFWDDRAMEGERQGEVITDADGYAAMYGLTYGTYYLVESKAPEGYTQMTAPIRVTVNKYSHLTAEDDIRDDEDEVIDNTIHIVTIRYSLPDTGVRTHSKISTALTGLTVSLGILLFLIRIRKRYMV